MLATERARRYWHVKHLLEASRPSHKDKHYYCWGGGRVHVSEVAPGVYRVAYGGAVSAECFYAMRSHAVAASAGARSIMLDATAMLSTSCETIPIPPDSGLRDLVPGVIVCRPDQHAAWSAYAAAMLERKVTRCVFLDHERADALLVAQAFARA